MRVKRLAGAVIALTGIACPCHVLGGAALALAAALAGGPAVPLSPAAQDGVHAVYMPLAVLLGAWLLGRGQPSVTNRRSDD